jgi:hypothetical protein
MSNENLLLIGGGELSDHGEPHVEILDPLHHETTSISDDITPTVRIHEEEITATTLGGASDQSTRINVYENIPFAGGDGDSSVLSVLFGLHSIGGGIFSFLTMKDSNKVRVQCRECRQAVMDFPWMDANSNIRGNMKAWRAAFPVARAVNVSERQDIVDADFVHIRGDARVRLHTVRMIFCHNVTDAAFVHLRGIHTLDMIMCTQETNTPLAIAHLVGIVKLDHFRCHRDIRIAASKLLGEASESESDVESEADVDLEADAEFEDQGGEEEEGVAFVAFDDDENV